MFDLFLQNWQTYLSGFGYTILCSAIALIASFILGTVFALLEITETKWIRFLAKTYIEIFRNIPLLVITLFFYLVIPTYFMKISGFTAGTIGLSLYTSAFIAETIRAGISAVGDGQMEGARSNGMTYLQAMRYVILPQAFHYALPAMGNQWISLIKNSSVLAFVAGFDLMYSADTVAFSTYHVIPAYVITGCFYLILTLPLNFYTKHLERRA
ncbi:MAG: amino acid ABC transporter permease [Lactobacillus sp.]|nr:amino acid ABC transporter permease [Lactobacillus sp.]